jgi:prepilin-type N-terminal cleavage/methylation domain-containing protein
MRIAPSRCRGLTLIECLVSTVLLSIGLVGVIGTLTAALITNQDAGDRQLAAAIVQATIEEMRSLGFGSVTYANFPANATFVQVLDLADLHGGTRTIEITDSYQGNPRLKHVRVTVSWRGRNGQNSNVSVETIITNRGGHTST